jgi:hypothetical protein
MNTSTLPQGKYPYGLTRTIRVYDMETGAFLRYEKQGEVVLNAEEPSLVIDAEAIRERVAAERAESLATVERDYEGV